MANNQPESLRNPLVEVVAAADLMSQVASLDQALGL